MDRFLVSLDQVRKSVIVAVLGLDNPGLLISHWFSSQVVLTGYTHWEGPGCRKFLPSLK
jgi:hypothetical protein